MSYENRHRDRLSNIAAVAALIGITMAAFWRTLRFYFLSDDFYLVQLANRSHFDVLAFFISAGSDGFFRPVGYLSLVLTSICAGVDPMAWHAAAVALHLANVILVFVLARRLCARRTAAFFAATLF